MSNLVYAPQDVARVTLETIRQRRGTKRRAVLSGIEALDEFLLPFWPGELIVVLAYTSHYKTSFMQFLAKNVADQVWAEAEAEKRTCDEMSVFVSWEMSIEEITFYDIARTARLSASTLWQGLATDDEMVRVEQAGNRRAVMPVWMLGYALGDANEIGTLTLPVVDKALLDIKQKQGVSPRAIFLDYLQEIDPAIRGERRMQVMDNAQRAKHMSRRLAAPVFLGVQAGRQTQDREVKLPHIGDGQETSKIEQMADKLISLWIPAKDYPIGYRLNDLDLEVTPNLLILGLRKQRGGESGQILPLYVDWERNDIKGKMDTFYGEQIPI